MELDIKALINDILAIKFREVSHELLAHTMEHVYGHDIDDFRLAAHQNNAGVNGAIRVTKEGGELGHFDESSRMLRGGKCIISLGLVFMNEE